MSSSSEKAGASERRPSLRRAMFFSVAFSKSANSDWRHVPEETAPERGTSDSAARMLMKIRVMGVVVT